MSAFEPGGDAKAIARIAASNYGGFAGMCQTAFKRDPRSASKKDPLADMIGVCRGEPCAACGGGRA